ncbi:MAG: hypothetical protein KatS3mg102_2883 [Planctomycetota bacterium]|nr:MAG: hypothetical protein KatS3mg102_2883 [Planctomycetota bacterium]
MPQGRVKWFDAKKGYGFIIEEGRAEDIFVHYSAIQSSGFRTLEDGEPVEFEIVPGKNGVQAANVIRLGAGAAQAQAGSFRS